MASSLRSKKSKSRFASPEKQSNIEGNNFTYKSGRGGGGGASSLVQIWEARLNKSNGGNSPIYEQSILTVHEETQLSPPSIDDGESESENESKGFNDRTVEIESNTLCSVSDSGVSKWSRVADIIRRLKLTAGDNVGAATDTAKDKCFSPVAICSPRLRGRQAFSDLLTRLERDRRQELESILERNAVSRFSQRGRLQSMLRLRSLKNGLAIQDRHRSNTKGDSNLFESGSLVLNLREKFRQNASNAAAKAEQRKDQQSNQETERSLEANVTNILPKASLKERLSPKNRKLEEAILCKNENEPKMSYLELQEIIVADDFDKTSPNRSISYQEPRILKDDEANKVENGTQRTQENTFLELHETRWEEQEEYEDEQSYYGETNNDWLIEISRPRTYWEDLRKSRYLEVINTLSDKDDICRLLHRRTVSGFLQSGLREKIDKLIMSRVQTQPVQRIVVRTAKEDEDRDDLSHTSSQIFAPSPAGSWSSQDTGVTSTPLNNIHSSEMEVISDLRSQILQLQLDMSELRDSVKTCLDVNASFQMSVQQENPLKRKCCVCNETQVETLLYRCGHMCTCLRCANELQCNGGKCPICRAKILDVVRVFVDSRT
ncbi:unnamed protein product [Cochlearia groenlandica]